MQPTSFIVRSGPRKRTGRSSATARIRTGADTNDEPDVTVEGEVDRETGYVLDLKRIKHVVRHSVVDDLDYRNLNLGVKWVEQTILTTDNLVVAIWDRIRPRLPEGIDLERLVLRETPWNWAEYEGG